MIEKVRRKKNKSIATHRRRLICSKHQQFNSRERSTLERTAESQEDSFDAIPELSYQRKPQTVSGLTGEKTHSLLAERKHCCNRLLRMIKLMRQNEGLLQHQPNHLASRTPQTSELRRYKVH
jgi:hypothetical protein